MLKILRKIQSGRGLPFATHQSSDGARLSPVEAGKSCSSSASKEFSTESDDNDSDSESPSDAVVKQSQICLETGKSKVLDNNLKGMEVSERERETHQWQEDDGNKILNLLS